MSSFCSIYPYELTSYLLQYARLVTGTTLAIDLLGSILIGLIGEVPHGSMMLSVRVLSLLWFFGAISEELSSVR
jgi:hypothetical protein